MTDLFDDEKHAAEKKTLWQDMHEAGSWTTTEW